MPKNNRHLVNLSPLMEIVLKTYIAIVISLLLAACSGTPCDLSSFDKVVYEPVHAKGFRILGTEAGSTLIISENPWQGASKVSKMLMILRSGESKPEGFEGQVISGDAARIICMSSSHVAMLGCAGAAGKVVGVSGLGYLYDENVREGEVSEVGYDEYVDYETLVSLRPDIVLLYGVQGESPLEKKLAELCIPYAYIGEYVEDNPLGKAEWMVAVGEIAGCRDAAVEAFVPVCGRYAALKEKVVSISRPKVMLNLPCSGTWFLPSEGSYMTRLIEDAGGDFVFRGKSGNASVVVDMEEAFLLCSQADIWLNVSGVKTLDELCERFPQFSGVRSVVKGAVYDNNLRLSPEGGNDFWESGVVRPDLVLQDLIGIIHPETAGDNELTYYRKIE